MPSRSARGEPPADAFADPRDPGLGWRAYGPDPAVLLAGVEPLAPEAMDARRIALGVPETGIELIPDDSYILEMDFERLNGVDFRKGCYVGQEVTARMKHKTELRKGLARVRLDGPAPPPGTESAPATAPPARSTPPTPDTGWPTCASIAPRPGPSPPARRG